MTLKNSHDATSSPGSEDGKLLLPEPDGEIVVFGLDLARVSPSLSPENKKEKRMKDTSGQTGSRLLTSAALQQSLENKLVRRLEGRGSTLFVLTWKHWNMRSGPPICALRASVRRTSGKDSGSWPTPNHNTTGPGRQGREGGMNLQTAVMLVGWGTPSSRDHKDGTSDGTAPINGLLGRQVWLINAEMKKRDRFLLNPGFSLWLMLGALATEWLSCGERVT